MSGSLEQFEHQQPQSTTTAATATTATKPTPAPTPNHHHPIILNGMTSSSVEPNSLPLEEPHSLPTPPTTSDLLPSIHHTPLDQAEHDNVVSDLQAILDAAPVSVPQENGGAYEANGDIVDRIGNHETGSESEAAPALLAYAQEQVTSAPTLIDAPTPVPITSAVVEQPTPSVSEPTTPPPAAASAPAPAPVLASSSSSSSISHAIPPPILPLPSHIDIPSHPAHPAPDSTSSLLVEPPTPAPLPPTSSSHTGTTTTVPAAVSQSTPASVPSSAGEDVQMSFEEPEVEPVQQELPSGLKRSAPGADDTEAIGAEAFGLAPSASGTLSPASGWGSAGEDEREAKRQKVEQSHSTPYTPPFVDSPAPTPAPAALPIPSAGYDPSAFISTPPIASAGASTPSVPPPTMSPNDLHLPPGATPLASTSAASAPAIFSAEPASTVLPPGPVPVFIKAQHGAGRNILRSLKNNRNAPPFLKPVDPVALGIPDYHRVITRPIDLGIIEEKLNATGRALTASAKLNKVFGLDYSGVGNWEGLGTINGDVYRTADEFKAELDRVWENCYKYNGPKEKNPVSAMAGVMQEVVEKLWSKFPVSEPIEYKPEPEPVRLPSPDVKKERRPSQSFVPTIRRSEETSRPKREIHAPVKELPYAAENEGKSRRGTGGVSNKAAQEQLRYCKEVMKELFKKTYETFAYVFYEPVNYVALNLPTYPNVIKKPMDFGTIRQKLDNNAYPMPPYPAFEADVRLVFKNCYTFNPPGTPVNEWGKKVEAIFDAKWDERPTGEDEEEESDDELTEMERRMKAMQAELEAMRQKKAAGKSSKAPSTSTAPAASRPSKPAKRPSMSGASGGRNSLGGSVGAAGKKRSSTGGPGGSGKKGKGRKKQDSDDEDEGDYDAPVPQAPHQQEQVTFDMKRELAVKIVNFEGENLEKAIDIIRNGRPELLSDANKEIELDIDQLDQRTLLNLYKFVCPKPTKAKPANRRAATGGTKRKNLDEIKESERIEMLEARLRDFENGGLPPKNKHATNDQASSDEESSDESGSESEDDN